MNAQEAKQNILFLGETTERDVITEKLDINFSVSAMEEIYKKRNYKGNDIFLRGIFNEKVYITSQICLLQLKSPPIFYNLRLQTLIRFY